MPKLKPCPFCGKEAISSILGFGTGIVIKISCLECRNVMKSAHIEAICSFVEFEKEIEKVASQWNRRADNG